MKCRCNNLSGFAASGGPAANVLPTSLLFPVLSSHPDPQEGPSHHPRGFKSAEFFLQGSQLWSPHQVCCLAVAFLS